MKKLTEITMREVAWEAGVAVSTVSKALRDDPTLPEKRCREIQRLARRMGYRPNPLVAALMARLHPQRRRREDPQRIAWIDYWRNDREGFSTFNVGPSLRGAQRRAAELGYGVEVHRPRVEGLSTQALGRILRARGHWGVILPPVPDDCRELDLDMRGLAAVTIGTSVVHPAMHRVAPDHFQGAALAFQRMRAKGFHRVGLVLDGAMNERVAGKWLGGYLAEQIRLPKRERMEPLILKGQATEAMAPWVTRGKLDAVLLARAEHADVWLHCGKNKDAVAWLALADELCGGAGLDYNAEALGGLAVDLVVGQIHRNERKPPRMPHVTLVEATWRET